MDIEGWPVQFLPTYNPLIAEAVEQAVEIKFKSTPTRVLSAEHLVAIMLQTGREKDCARVEVSGRGRGQRRAAERHTRPSPTDGEVARVLRRF